MILAASRANSATGNRPPRAQLRNRPLRTRTPNPSPLGDVWAAVLAAA
jgi:hypothetical protein